MVVRPLGDPVAANRSPMPRRTASGQPRPEDELTLTTASSGIRAPASVGETTGTLRTRDAPSPGGGRGRLLPRDLYGAAALGGLLDCECDRQGANAVDAVHQRTAGTADGRRERLERDLIEVTTVTDGDLGLPGLAAEYHSSHRVLCHDV